MKFAELKDPAGSPQPITTRPTLGKVDDKRVVFVATGKYLENSDLTDTQKQSLYAIKDDNATATLVNPRTTLVEQILTNNSNERTVTANPVDFSVQRGWYVDFPDSGERSNVNPLLAWGVIVAPTIVPTSSVCSPGGYGWLNYFDYKTGGLVPDALDGLAGQKFDSPIVGITPVRKSDGSGEILITKGDGGLEKPRKRVTPSGNSSGFVAKRVIWRELVQ
jgi:type IV pilus assembly protein PilY1